MLPAHVKSIAGAVVGLVTNTSNASPVVEADTVVTVPDPPAGVTHVPSPLKKVDAVPPSGTTPISKPPLYFNKVSVDVPPATFVI